ncbi:MAG TPA: glycosyltransferase family 2 protein [Hyphomonadaceae bacterium]|nr:glycosyltransferase family 2 protein [Hyphomonadaceae bacterium]
MRIALVILTRNELACAEKVMPTVAQPGPDAGYDSWHVVDGGSTDGTVEYFQKLGIEVIKQSDRGRGHAFQLAFERIAADAYIFFSPDGNEDPKDMPKFRAALEAGADIVIASRMMKGARNEEDHLFFRWRKWANNAFNFLANLAFRKTGPFVSDSINGFRAITAKAAQDLRLDAWDYTIEYQMTMRALKKRMRIAEFPTIEGERVAGETQARSIPTGLRFLKAYWRELTS